MSQAEALLQSLTENVPTHDHMVTDQDSYFVINPDTREIENASRTRNVLMQYDHNSEKFTFELTRYVEGHDMMLCNRVRVHFNNVDGETNEENADVAELNDLALDPDDDTKVLCSWTITRQATQLVGTLNFLVQYECIDDAGNSVYEWHTDIYDEVLVKKSRNNGEQAVIEYSNILEQWYQRIFGTGDAVLANITAEGEKQVAAVTAEGKRQVAAVAAEGAAQKEAVALKGEATLATIPDDYTTTYNMAEEALRRKAAAIELEAEGETIFVSDSSDAHLLGLNVYGKTTQFTTTGAQLAYISNVESYENNGIVWSSNGGIVTAKGNAPIHSYTPSNIHADLKGLVGTFYLSGNGKYIKVAVQYTRDGVTNYINAPQEFTLDGTETRVELYCQITTYNTDINDVAYPMVNVGNAALPWEPYTGGKASPNPEYPQALESVKNPTIEICGKNLVRTNYDKTDTYEGLTIVITKGSSEVLLDGTTTKSYGYAISHGTYLTPGRYTMSVHGLNILSKKHDHAYLMNVDTRNVICANVQSGSPVTFDVVDAGIYRIDFVFASGTTYKNTIVKFQIEAGDTATDYEPCIALKTLLVNHTLPGIPVASGGNYIDENGQQWICDEIDLERGVYVQRIYAEQAAVENIKSVDNTYTNLGGTVVYYDPAYVHPANDDIQLVVCDKLLGMSCNDRGSYNSLYRCYAPAANVDALILRYPKELGEKTLEDAKTDFAGVKLSYVLSTPIETPLTEEEIAKYKKLKTNYHNTTVMNDGNAYMAIKYAADTLIYLRDHQPKPTDEQVQAAVNEYASQNGVQVPTDDHINALINEALGVIVNDEY